MRASVRLLVALLVFKTCEGTTGQAAPPDAPPAAHEVLRVVDGDTVVIRLDGKPTTVRLIGIDTPETVHQSKPVERFGREASKFLESLIGGKSVRLEHDPGSARQDRYGRTLAYLYLEPGGLFVNREIAARGYGYAYTRYPFRHMEEFRAAEQSARERRLGLWGPDVGEGPDDTAPAHTVVYVSRTGSKYHRSNCRALARGSTPMPLDSFPRTSAQDAEKFLGQ